jgi:hypothetical protein
MAAICYNQVMRVFAIIVPDGLVNRIEGVYPKLEDAKMAIQKRRDGYIKELKSIQGRGLFEPDPHEKRQAERPMAQIW